VKDAKSQSERACESERGQKAKVKELVKVKEAKSESERACDFTDVSMKLMLPPISYIF